MAKKRSGWQQMDKASTPLAQLLHHFEVGNQTEGKSDETVTWYNNRLGVFLRWLQESNPGLLKDFTKETVREFIRYLQTKSTKFERNRYTPTREAKLSTHPVNGYARALRGFSSWLHRERYTETNILKELKPPKVRKEVIDTLSEEEMRRLFAAIDPDTPLGCRNYAILVTFLDTGLRCSELCNLTLENARIEEGYLKVLGKGDKERLVPIGAACKFALLRWRDHFRPSFIVQESPLFFLSNEGRELTVGAIEQLVGRLGTRTGVPRLYAHLLRHTFATSYLVHQVGDSLRLQQILGHTTLEMTRRYANAAAIQQNLLERRSSPLDVMGLGRLPSHRRGRPNKTHDQRPVNSKAGK
ncbi:MAG: tyrosine-type recombinase/integrase [Chloroflexi bacterium]|nr:tyrosine-type recombinase/integrase [Chloroflexota bacterium]